MSSQDNKKDITDAGIDDSSIAAPSTDVPQTNTTLTHIDTTVAQDEAAEWSAWYGNHTPASSDVGSAFSDSSSDGGDEAGDRPVFSEIDSTSAGYEQRWLDAQPAWELPDRPSSPVANCFDEIVPNNISYRKHGQPTEGRTYPRLPSPRPKSALRMGVWANPTDPVEFQLPDSAETSPPDSPDKEDETMTKDNTPLNVSTLAPRTDDGGKRSLYQSPTGTYWDDEDDDEYLADIINGYMAHTTAEPASSQQLDRYGGSNEAGPSSERPVSPEDEPANASPPFAESTDDKASVSEAFNWKDSDSSSEASVHDAFEQDESIKSDNGSPTYVPIARRKSDEDQDEDGDQLSQLRTFAPSQSDASAGRTSSRDSPSEQHTQREQGPSDSDAAADGPVSPIRSASDTLPEQDGSESDEDAEGKVSPVDPVTGLTHSERLDAIDKYDSAIKAGSLRKQRAMLKDIETSDIKRAAIVRSPIADLQDEIELLTVKLAQRIEERDASRAGQRHAQDALAVVRDQLEQTKEISQKMEDYADGLNEDMTRMEDKLHAECQRLAEQIEVLTADLAAAGEACSERGHNIQDLLALLNELDESVDVRLVPSRCIDETSVTVSRPTGLLPDTAVRWPEDLREKLAEHIATYITDLHLHDTHRSFALETETVQAIFADGTTSFLELVRALNELGYQYRPDHFALELERYFRKHGKVLIEAMYFVRADDFQGRGRKAVARLLIEINKLQAWIDDCKEHGAPEIIRLNAELEDQRNDLHKLEEKLGRVLKDKKELTTSAGANAEIGEELGATKELVEECYKQQKLAQEENNRLKGQVERLTKQLGSASDHDACHAQIRELEAKLAESDRLLKELTKQYWALERRLQTAAAPVRAPPPASDADQIRTMYVEPSRVRRQLEKAEQRLLARASPITLVRPYDEPSTPSRASADGIAPLPSPIAVVHHGSGVTPRTPLTPGFALAKPARWVQREASVKNSAAYQRTREVLREQREVDEAEDVAMEVLRTKAYEQVFGMEIVAVTRVQRLEALRALMK